MNSRCYSDSEYPQGLRTNRENQASYCRNFAKLMRILVAIGMPVRRCRVFRQVRPGSAEPIRRDLNSLNIAAKILPMSPIRSLVMHGFEFHDYPFSATRFVAIQATAQWPEFPIGFRHAPRDDQHRRTAPEGGTGAPTSSRVAIAASAEACFAHQRRHVPIFAHFAHCRTDRRIIRSARDFPFHARQSTGKATIGRDWPARCVHHMFQISVCRRGSCRLYAGKHSKRPAVRGGRRMR